MNKFKTTGFWISLSGAIMLVVQTVLGAFNITFNSEIISNIVSAMCSALVFIGVLIPTQVDSLKIEFPVSTETEDDTSKQVKISTETENSKSNKDITK